MQRGMGVQRGMGCSAGKGCSGHQPVHVGREISTDPRRHLQPAAAGRKLLGQRTRVGERRDAAEEQHAPSHRVTASLT